MEKPTYCDQMIYNLFKVLSHKILLRKTDFFLHHKFTMIKDHYGQNCLDIGTGTGRFAQFLFENEKTISAIDIVNKIEFDLPFSQFNGTDIPFDANSMDTLMLFFVLHHTDDQVQLLHECKRVVSGKIVIGEDIIENRFDKIMGRIHLGTSPWAKSENGFRTDAGWKALFEELDLKLVDELTIPRNTYPVYPIARKIYIVENK